MATFVENIFEMILRLILIAIFMYLIFRVLDNLFYPSNNVRGDNNNENQSRKKDSGSGRKINPKEGEYVDYEEIK